MKPPASGVILAYILRILEDMLHADDELAITQRVTEAFKYAYALRGELGDHHFINVTEVGRQILRYEPFRFHSGNKIQYRLSRSESVYCSLH